MAMKAGYVDGFVFVVKKNKLAAYKKMAREGSKMWKQNGALDYMECMGDDLAPKMAAYTFPQMVKPKKDETVWFSFITYKSKKHRDQVNAKVMKGMELNAKKYQDYPMPFDMKRMAVGGFKVVVGT